MTDPFNTASFKDKTSNSVFTDASNSRKKGKKKKKAKTPSLLYQDGIDLFKSRNIRLELCPEGTHVLHKVWIPDKPRSVVGISYPDAFQPWREIHSMEDFFLIESVLATGSSEVKDFWQPLVHPKAGDSDLKSFSEVKLKMKEVQEKRELYEDLNYEHTFDPTGQLTGNKEALNPRIWVPDRSWFDPVLHQVKFEDVFTIFPKAERELLKLLIGRIGVGRSGHIPPGFSNPVKHTARMAAVIIGVDAGLGKSTIFSKLIAAISTTGFTSHTFRSSDAQFGLAKAAKCDLAYKDDTAMASLKKLLASENTKILVTNGKLETEEKFSHSKETNPKCVLLINSNDWKPEFAYDLDPGIIDRIKLLATHKEVEVLRRINVKVNPLCEGSPDLRPYQHIPWLAEKLGVSEEALFLWCLRLCTDHFWEIINDYTNPTKNRLQEEVRKWTTRLRIKFKADMSKSFMKACILSSMIRCNGDFVPREMNYEVLSEAISDFWFLGQDPSGNRLMKNLKEDWEKGGRVTTHPYQAFREIQWPTVTSAINVIAQQLNQNTVPDSEKTKRVLKMLFLRDNFSLNTGYSFAGSDWSDGLFALEQLKTTAKNAIRDLDIWDLKRIQGRDEFANPDSEWMDSPQYSPKTAETLREKRKNELRELEERVRKAKESSGEI